MSLPKKCLVDTNVPKIANLATKPNPDSDVSDACVLACIEAVEHVIKKRGLIIDAGDEIFDEYRQQLSMKVIGRFISRAEALRIARKILEQAERERLIFAEYEAARGIQWENHP
jgi:hypothetical protein